MDDRVEVCMTEEAKAWKFEDDLTTVDSLLSDIQRVLLRAALKGGVSGDTRAVAIYKLQKALEVFKKLPEDR